MASVNENWRGFFLVLSVVVKFRAPNVSNLLRLVFIWEKIHLVCVTDP